MLNIILISIINLLTYISHEMIYPIVPIYLTVTLGATPIAVGLIEGISKSISSIVKFYSGYFSDKQNRRKEIISIGYLGSLINRILLVFSASWPSILFGKITDRFGKGIRTPSMEAIISEGFNEKHRGKAFGINRFFQKLGASIGILISYIILKRSNDINFKTIFIVSIIPLLIIFILLYFVKEKEDRKFKLVDLKLISKPLKIFLFIAFFSSLANTSKSFMLLRASSLNFNSNQVILLYLLSNISSCLWSYQIGKICDKFKKKNIIAFAYLIYSLLYLGLGIGKNSTIITLLFFIHGLYIALISVSVKSFITELAPKDMKATLCGLNDCLVGLATLPATIVGGILWTEFGASFPFYISSIIAFLSFIGVAVFIKNPIITRYS